jgi:hypothetical protein
MTGTPQVRHSEATLNVFKSPPEGVILRACDFFDLPVFLDSN